MNSFPDILSAFQKGMPVIVYDEDREIEGDFFIAAEDTTSEKVNFLLQHARGMICVACVESIIKQFELPLMAENNENPLGTNFCLSFDAKDDVTTGVSAPDRAQAIALLARKDAGRSDIVCPGHTFPLLAKNPKKRWGHTEAAVALAQECEKVPAVTICEILNQDGEKANLTELRIIAETQSIPITTLKQLKSELVQTSS